MTIASTGIASILIPDGKIAHSRFKIQINIDEDSTCNTNQGNPLAELIIKTSIIICDEAPMTHKHCFEAVDRTLRDILILNNPECLKLPFGGKVVILGGDFIQIFSVIPKGTRQDIIRANINFSYLS